MNQLKNIKGVSMPLVIGLVLLLTSATLTINELVIQALRSASQVEAADRAYFVAEAGIEDALYELSPHFAGYETPDLGTDNVRKVDYGGNVAWNGEWTIRSHAESDPPVLSDSTEFSGIFRENQKLILSYFNDKSGSGAVATNEISTVLPNIDKIPNDLAADFRVIFEIPDVVKNKNPSAFIGGLAIDNDNDLGNSIASGPTGVTGLNEDGAGDVGFCGGSSIPSNDSDCDGQDDEDSPEDRMVYWKVTDDTGRSLTPVKGCFTGADPPDDPKGTELCEKDFNGMGMDLGAFITRNFDGINNEGDPEDIRPFITNTPNDQKVQFEFSILSPLEQVDAMNPTRKIDIPYLEYTYRVPNANATNPIPLPYFTIKSDGYYRDFKQSITTTVMPKTAVPLFDFTIIQQQ